MKQIVFSLTLFLFFVGILSGVDYLDTQSTHYVQCVRLQAANIENSAFTEQDRQNLLESLEAPNPALHVKGKSCPPLLTAHKAKLISLHGGASQ